MSWVFPKSLFRTGTVYDWLEFDEQLVVYSSEVNGFLNEHNFDESIGSDLRTNDSLLESVAVRLVNTSDHVDVYTEASLDPIPNTEQWHPVTGTTMTLRSRGGAMYATYSFQVVFYDMVAGEGPGLQFAIELDGSVQYNTLLGSGDLSNDYFEDDDIDSSELSAASGGGSVKARLSPHCVEGFFPIDAGPHTVKLVARNPYSLRSGTRQEQYIGCFEGIIMEIHQ